jgi:hypothetical protein
MSTDRKQTLERRAIAQQAMNDPDLAPAARAAAKRVFDRSTVVLGMEDAETRAKAKQEAAAQ